MTNIENYGKDQLKNQSERPSEETGAGTSTGSRPAGLPAIPKFFVRYWFPPESKIFTHGHMYEDEFQRHKESIRRKSGVIIDEGLW